jgi:hypothetical protein
MDNIPNFVWMAGERKIALILDNAPYHGRVRSKIPWAKNSKKKEMIDFLEFHGLEFCPTSTKAVLDGLIENFVKDRPEFGEKEVEVSCNFHISVTAKP